jgi:hypothetical protein
LLNFTSCPWICCWVAVCFNQNNHSSSEQIHCKQHFIYHTTLNLVKHYYHQLLKVRFEVFTVVTMKNAIFWDVVPCSSCVNRRFRGTYRLHLQHRKIRKQGTSVSSYKRTTPHHVPEDGRHSSTSKRSYT